jgi:hypothetical protein
LIAFSSVGRDQPAADADTRLRGQAGQARLDARGPVTAARHPLTIKPPGFTALNPSASGIDCAMMAEPSSPGRELAEDLEPPSSGGAGR